jgi:hypothetical protein
MRKLTVKNFSVIKEAELEFGKITVLIGPQSSGKSILCRLAYFLGFELIAEATDFATSGQSWDEFEARTVTRFNGWFPSDAWGSQPFLIQLQYENYTIKLSGHIDDTDGPLVSVHASDEFKHTYWKLSQDDNDPAIPSTPLSLKVLAWNEFIQLQGVATTSSTHFLPAGRAFFTNADLGFATMQNAGLDPLIRRFATEIIWNPTKWMPGLLVSGRDTPESIKETMDHIAGGTVIFRENQPVFKTFDDRIIPLPLLSSGAQELLPLFNVLNRLVYTHEHTGVYARSQLFGSRPRTIPAGPLLYLEEPEAHVFPSTQYELVKLFARLAIDPILDFSWVITTHSPYILSGFNDLIEAGRLGAETALSKEVNKIIPEKFWIKPGDFKAYSIHDGKLQSIMDTETGLINGEYLDAISNKIGGDFDALLRIGYAKS